MPLRVNGGQALMHSLDCMGVEYVFGVPGHGQYEAVDALHGHPSIRYVSNRNEQEAGFMADACTQVTGRPAVVQVVSGPGLMYAGAGLVSAFANSTPILVVTGANSNPVMGRNQLEYRTLGAMTKWTGQVEAVEEIPDAVEEAFRQMYTGRPRPTGLIVPAHILAATGTIELPSGAPQRERIVAPGVEEAIQKLHQASRPLLWVGAGALQSGAQECIRSMARRLGIPVVSTHRGKGIMEERTKLGLGTALLAHPPLRGWIQSRDLILAIGVGRPFQDMPVPIVQIDVDPEFPTRGQRDTLWLQGDARATLEAIAQGCRHLPAGHFGGAELDREIEALHAERWNPDRQLQPQWDYIQAIRGAAPANTIFIQGMNQMGYYSRHYLSMPPGGQFLTSSTQATLGGAYPLSLGARLAAPDRPVIAITGDGGFVYGAQAMATAVQNRIHSVVLVFNDNAYGNVLRAQKEEFDNRVIGTRLHNPDFPALAQSFGARGRRAHSAPELQALLEEALQTDAHTMIEIPVGEMDRMY